MSLSPMKGVYLNYVNLFSKYPQIFTAQQADLKKILSKALVHEYNYKINESQKYVYAEGDTPVMLVSHMDTVHTTPPSNIFFDSFAEVMWSPQGLGADDRAGVLAVLNILERGIRPHVLFTCDEEIGGLGARDAKIELTKPDVKFIIEFDRHGKEDAVYYDCGNKDFYKMIESYGFVHAEGTFSDVAILSRGWDIAGVNLSIGYYNEHTKAEYLNLKEWSKTVDRAYNILIEEAGKDIYYDAQEIHYNMNSLSSFSRAWGWDSAGLYENDFDDDSDDSWAFFYYGEERALKLGYKKPQKKTDAAESATLIELDGETFFEDEEGNIY